MLSLSSMVLTLAPVGAQKSPSDHNRTTRSTRRLGDWVNVLQTSQPAKPPTRQAAALPLDLLGRPRGAGGVAVLAVVVAEVIQTKVVAASVSNVTYP